MQYLGKAAIVGALFFLAGCVSVGPFPERTAVQDLHARDGQVVSPALQMEQQLDSGNKVFVQLQAHSGRGERALALYDFILSSYATTPPPERFKYKDILIEGDPQADSPMRSFATDVAYNALEIGHYWMIKESQGWSVQLAALFKLGWSEFAATESGDVSNPAEFTVREDDKSLGFALSFDYVISESIATGVYFKGYQSPFDRVSGAQGGIAVEYSLTRQVAVRYALQRQVQWFRGEPSELRFTLSGQQLGLVLRF